MGGFNLAKLGIPTRKKLAAVMSFLDMLEAGKIDEEAALQALKNVKG